MHKDVYKILDFSKEDIERLKKIANMEEDEIIIKTTKVYREGNTTRKETHTETKSKKNARNILNALNINY